MSRIGSGAPPLESTGPATRWRSVHLRHRRCLQSRQAKLALSRAELMQLGLSIRDDYQVPLTGGHGSHGVIDSILAALKEALTRCRGPEEIWMARDLKRAIVLIGGLDEATAQEILGQERA